MKANIWLCLAVFSALLNITASAAADVELKGALYKLGSNRQEKLYTWEMKTCSNVWTSQYYRLDGTLAVEDRTRFDGKQLAEYSYVRHTIGESSSVKLTGNQLTFNYRRFGQTKAETLTTSDVFLTGPSVFAFIQQHLKELLAGKEFDFKYGVLDRLDYFTFELSSENEPDSKTARIRVRATSPFVRMAVDPSYVTLSKEGKFKGVVGRSIVMEKNGNKLLPIDADLVVESEAPANCARQPPSTPPRGAGGNTGKAD